MVRLNKIYTKTGDGGDTALGDGSRRPKHDGRVEAYGTVDEANAFIGLGRLHVSADLDALLARVQNDLFDLGADLCVPHSKKQKGEALRITKEQCAYLEDRIDHYNAELPPLKSFILPAGTAAATYLHAARTVVRRAERAVSALAERETTNPQALIYLNRLSDLLFVLSRFANVSDKKGDEVLWQAGLNRGDN